MSVAQSVYMIESGLLLFVTVFIVIVVAITTIYLTIGALILGEHKLKHMLFGECQKHQIERVQKMALNSMENRQLDAIIEGRNPDHYTGWR